MKKMLLIISAVTITMFLFATGVNAETHTLEPETFLSTTTNLNTLFFDQNEIVEESSTRRIVGGSPPPASETRAKTYAPGYNGQGRPIWSIKVGWLMIGHAQDETPTNAPTIGISVKFPGPPSGMQALELSLDTTIDRLELDPTPTISEDFYEEYFDLILSYTSRFPSPTGGFSPLSWGVGLGYAKETARANYTDSARAGGFPGAAEASNESGVFQFKLQLETQNNVYFELAYKKLFDSERNLDQLFNLALGIYF